MLRLVREDSFTEHPAKLSREVYTGGDFMEACKALRMSQRFALLDYCP